MKKLTLLLILLIGSFSYGQVILYQNAPDRQKITEFEKRNDSIVISLQNSGTNKIFIGDMQGQSAYQIAVDNGFGGTEQEWLESLQGTIDISPKWVEVTADRDLLSTDIGKILYNTGATDVTITIPTDLDLDIAEDVSFTAWHEGAGKVRFKSGTGVTANPIQTVGTTLIEPLSYMRRGANNWIGVKGEMWDPYGPELYDNSNCLALVNNANSVTGLDAISGTTQLSVANTSPSPGSYAWEITSTSVHESSRGRAMLTVDDANGTYRIEFWARQSAGVDSGGAGFRVQIPADTYIQLTTSWAKYSVDMTVTSVNPQLNFHTNRSSNALPVGSIGDAIQVTGLTVKKIL